MEKCKQRAREVVYWSDMNHDIVHVLKQWKACQANQKQQMAEPLISHSLPIRPWQKVSTDLFELKRQNYIVIVGRKEMFYLTMHSTHFIYGYMVSDIW